MGCNLDCSNPESIWLRDWADRAGIIFDATATIVACLSLLGRLTSEQAESLSSRTSFYHRSDRCCSVVLHQSVNPNSATPTTAAIAKVLRNRTVASRIRRRDARLSSVTNSSVGRGVVSALFDVATTLSAFLRCLRKAGFITSCTPWASSSFSRNCSNSEEYSACGAVAVCRSLANPVGDAAVWVSAARMESVGVSADV